MIEQTFVAIKPDGVKRKLIGKIISRFEDLDFTLKHAKLMNVSRELAKEHYVEHKDKAFFSDLVAFITSGEIFAMVWEGENAIEITRKIIGSTNCIKADAGTIRGDFGNELQKNIIHASDSLESAKREIKLFFE